MRSSVTRGVRPGGANDRCRERHRFAQFRPDCSHHRAKVKGHFHPPLVQSLSAFPKERNDAEGEDQCTQQLAAAEEAVQNKIDAQTLSEEDTENVNELLDQADAQCTEGNLAEATATLATVNKMVGK